MGREGQSADDAAATLSRFVFLQLLVREEQLAHENHHTLFTVIPEKQPLLFPGLSSAAPTPPPSPPTSPSCSNSSEREGPHPKFGSTQPVVVFVLHDNHRGSNLHTGLDFWIFCAACVPCTSALTSTAASGLLLCRDAFGISE